MPPPGPTLGVASPIEPTLLWLALVCTPAPTDEPFTTLLPVRPVSGTGSLLTVTLPPSPSVQLRPVQVASQPKMTGPSRSKKPAAQGPRPQTPAVHGPD